MGNRGTVDTVLDLGGAPRMRRQDGVGDDEQTPPGDAIDAFVADLEGDAIKGLWTVEGRIDAPSRIAPHVWRWHALRRHLDRAGDLMRLSNAPLRRALLLWNPGARDHWDATGTLTVSVQMMLPGESVTAHRHIHSTMMYITHGSGAYTVVDGERIALASGDLVLAPNWAWHEHGNESQGEIIWMTGLDRSLVKLFDAIYFEGYPGGGRQPVTAVDDGVTPRPSVRADPRFSAQLVWRSNEILARLAHLDTMGEATPYDDIIEVFRNPATGGHVTPTFGCAIQVLRPGIHTRAHRHTTSAVYHVVRGRGYSVIGGRRYDWAEGDYFALPHRTWHEHANASPSEPAILFSLTDEPTFEGLALRREEHLQTNGGFQKIEI